LRPPSWPPLSTLACAVSGVETFSFVNAGGDDPSCTRAHQTIGRKLVVVPAPKRRAALQQEYGVSLSDPDR